MQTKGFTCYLHGSVPDAELEWNLAFWRQTLSIVVVLESLGWEELRYLSSGAWRGAPDKVATLKVRKGAFDALNKGSGVLGKVKKRLSPPSAAAPWRTLLGILFATPTPTYKAKIWTKIWPPNCRICLVLKHFWGHILSRCLFIFLPCMWGAGVTSVFLIYESLWGFQTAAQCWIKIVHPWAQRFYPVLALESARRLLWHFPVLYWMNFSLRNLPAEPQKFRRILGIGR